jgi:DNA polymerase III delta prime subunit
MTNQFGSLWIEKWRPKTLDEIVLSKDDREFFNSLKAKGEIPHLLFAGPAGVGKTTTAKVIIRDALGEPNFLYLNASDENSIDVIRSRVVSFAQTKSFDGRMKIVLLDEVDGLSGPAQDALRNTIEEYSSNNRFIMTCNYLHKITKPIQSRCTIVNLLPPAEGIVGRISEILKAENISVEPSQKPLLLKHIKANLPDLRRIINDIQKFSVTGTLQIRHDASTEFAEQILKKVINKGDLISLRKEIIENEKAFSNDYRSLLKQLFEATYNSDLTTDKKTEAMLIISKHMTDDAFVIDKEINCFTTLINLARSI